MSQSDKQTTASDEEVIAEFRALAREKFPVLYQQAEGKKPQRVYYGGMAKSLWFPWAWCKKVALVPVPGIFAGYWVCYYITSEGQLVVQFTNGFGLPWRYYTNLTLLLKQSDLLKVADLVWAIEAMRQL